VNERIAEAVIAALDTIARDYDRYEYGLPLGDEQRAPMVAAVLRELAPLLAENERLKAALKPFADEWHDAVSKHPVFDTTDPEKREKVAWVAGVVKLGDCRRAAELLGAGSPGS
jgi:negative regulator of sigma E activity